MIVHVGDKVRIRDWDDMAAEFGVNAYDEIPCRMTFIRDMQKYCGYEYTVAEVYGEHDDSFLCTFEEGDTRGYTWSSDMIQIGWPSENKIAISSLEGLV